MSECFAQVQSVKGNVDKREEKKERKLLGRSEPKIKEENNEEKRDKNESNWLSRKGEWGRRNRMGTGMNNWDKDDGGRRRVCRSGEDSVKWCMGWRHHRPGPIRFMRSLKHTTTAAATTITTTWGLIAVSDGDWGCCCHQQQNTFVAAAKSHQIKGDSLVFNSYSFADTGNTL